MPSTNPTIVVPGVTATYLRDLYPLPPDAIWTLMRHNYKRARLHPDDLRYEAEQPAVVRPDQVYEIAYEELVEELRHGLSWKADDPVPVFPFGYDWRHPLHLIEEKLAEFIDEAIDRTRLMKNYNGGGSGKAGKVNLIGHSMGGLVIAGYLERFGAGKVNRVVSLASPFRGSFESIVKMTTGTAEMGGSKPRSREREAARLTPSLYHLLPNFKTGIITDPADNLPKSTFDSKLWQPSIIATISEYVRLHGVEEGLSEDELAKRGLKIFRGLLQDAKAHRARLEALNLKDSGLSDKRWLCVAGVGARTRVRMKVTRDSRTDEPTFVLTSKDRLDHWEDENASEEQRRQTGDGTVHFEGAIPGFIPYESIVCVTPRDYGAWEWQDTLATNLGGFHGILPNMNMLHRMIIRFLTDTGDIRKNTWGAPPPGVPRKDWKPPMSGLKT